MLVLSAGSLVFQMLSLLTVVVDMVRGRDRFGLTVFNVEVMSHRYFHADILGGEITTVVTMKTREYAVKTLEVRMNDKSLTCSRMAFVKMLQSTKLYLISL